MGKPRIIGRFKPWSVNSKADRRRVVHYQRMMKRTNNRRKEKEVTDHG
ncbi:MAG: hypothetical protein J6Q53_05065 [Oscillospiraceae bacterium]|nr:hypothetical protein [Oscillospiraceae bacterium]